MLSWHQNMERAYWIYFFFISTPVIGFQLLQSQQWKISFIFTALDVHISGRRIFNYKYLQSTEKTYQIITSPCRNSSFFLPCNGISSRLFVRVIYRIDHNKLTVILPISVFLTIFLFKSTIVVLFSKNSFHMHDSFYLEKQNSCIKKYVIKFNIIEKRKVFLS